MRSLAVFRIGLGLFVFLYAVLSLADAEAFLSDQGILPREILTRTQWESPMLWSLHLLSGSVGFQWVLLLLQALAGVSLALGFRTRTATILSWILVCSLETRNPLILNGADIVLRILLFWSIFIPLARCWSMDSMRTNKPLHKSTVVSIAGFCLIAQILFVYVFAAALKDTNAWWTSGHALLVTLNLDIFATPLGVWLRGHAEWCRWLCRASYLLELVMPWVILLPFWRTGFRLAAIIGFCLFHLGIGLCMDIGFFPWLMMSAWLVLIPASVWDRAANMFKRPRLALHTSVGRSMLPGRGFRWAAVAVNVFVVVCFAYVFLWNLRGTNFAKWEKIFPRSINHFAFALRLDQYWSMFAPTPLTEDGWYILKASLSDGSDVDLLRNGAQLDWNKPALASALYKDSRWQKLLVNLWTPEFRNHRVRVGEYICRKWNQQQGALSQAVAWNLHYMMELTRPDGSTAPVRSEMLAGSDVLAAR